MKHYLLSIYVTPETTLHAYTVCSEPRQREIAVDQLTAAYEKSAPTMPPIIMMTELSTGVDRVREIIAELSDEAEEKMESATDFHLTVFELYADDPLDQELVGIH